MRLSRQAVGQRRIGSRKLTSLMTKIDKEEYQKRLDKISAMFAEMIQHADELSTHGKVRLPQSTENHRGQVVSVCRRRQAGLSQRLGNFRSMRQLPEAVPVTT